MQQFTLTFSLYLAVIILLGFWAYSYTRNLSDYVLGGRKLSPAMTALGAGAADMSGWLVMALPGAIFLSGASRLWLPLGLVIGAWLNWTFVAPRLREQTEYYNDSLTVPSYLFARFNDKNGSLRLLTALIVIIFFTFYAAANFVAAGKMLQFAFDISYTNALLASAGIIILYTMIGGFLALNWIDFFQGIMMFFALTILPAIVFYDVGMTDLKQLAAMELPKDYFNWFSGNSYQDIISNLTWGLGYFGQLHILVRFMAIKNTAGIPTARNICMVWMIIALLGAITVGFFARLIFGASFFEPETSFFALIKNYCPMWLAGILVAAGLSTVMSTVSAQLLAAASSVVEDFYHYFSAKKVATKYLVWMGRLSVIIVSAVALNLASYAKNTVLELVGYAWAGLGASFGPVILGALFYRDMNKSGAMAGMIAGCISVIGWSWLASNFKFLDIYPLLPAFIISSICIVIFSKFSKELN